MNDKPTYQELENQISELEKQNEILRLNFADESVKYEQAETEKAKANLQIVRLTKALDHLNTYVYIKDELSCYVYANQQTLDLFNCSAEELLGCPDSCFFPADTCKQLLAIDKRVLVHGEDTEVEVESKALDGSRRVFWEIKTPMYDVDNKIVGICGVSTDITDRKKSEEELSKSLSLLTATLESTVDGILVVDKNGKIKRFNNKFVELWRIPDSLMSTRDDEKILASVLDQLSDPISFLIKVKEIYSGDKESFDIVEFKDGRIFERYSQAQKLDGKSIGRVWSFRDVTESYKIDKALKESEEKYKDLVETADIAILIDDENGFFEYFNNKFCEIFGFSKKEIEQLSIHNLVHQDDVEFVIEHHNNRIRGDKVKAKYEFRGVCKNGKTVHLMTSVVPVKSNDKIIGSRSYIWDITERKKAEQALIESESRYKSIFYENKSVMLIIEPKAGRIIDSNHSALSYYGYSKEELLSLNIADINILSRVQVDLEMQKVVNGNDNYFEFRHKLANGNIRDVHIYSSKIEIDKKIYLHSIIHDITAQRIAEESLKESETQLRELNATKDKLLSIIAHDLRSPFNGILGFTDILIENIYDFEIAETEEFVRIINSSAKNTLSLLDNLLNWAKTQTGQISFDPEIIIMSSIIREVIELSHSSAVVKDISLIQNQSDEIKVYADENMLRTVLRNLISNAIKFTKPGGNINIYVISKHNQVEISISDNGVGINDQTLNNLFDISTTTTSYDTANEKGSGLGLVLCKEFVEKLGGNIWAESEVGKGSDFKFTLPLCKS